jgi:hypothetical protein
MGLFDEDLGAPYFKELASRLGATVVRASRKGAVLSRRGIVVEIEEHHTNQHCTVKFRAALPSPGLPTFRIYPEGFQSFMSKVFGGQDVEVGHHAFDMAFMVKARAPEIFKRLWTDAASDRLLLLGDAWIEGEDRTLTLHQRVDYDSLPRTREGIELVFMLGDVDLYGRDVLRGLPDAQFRTDAGEVWLPGPGNVRFGFTRSDTFPEDVMINLKVHSDPAPELSPELVQRCAELDATVASVYTFLYAVWGHGEHDPAKFLRVVEILRQLIAGPSDGMFR